MVFRPNSEPKQHPSCKTGIIVWEEKMCLIFLIAIRFHLLPFLHWNFHKLRISGNLTYLLFGLGLLVQLCHARWWYPILPSHLFLVAFCYSLLHPSSSQYGCSDASYLSFCSPLFFCFSSPLPQFLAITRKSCKEILLFPEQSMPERIARAQFGRGITIQMEHPWWTGHKSLLDFCHIFHGHMA